MQFSVRHSAILMIGYLASGWAGLTLAVAPGYTSALWLPAGVSLMGLLLLGWKYWPAILAGGWLTYASYGYSQGLSLSDTRFYWLPLVLALSACLQALIAYALIHRHPRFTLPPLESLRSIVRIIVIGGPASCLVSSLIVAYAFVSAGMLPVEQYVFYAFTTWIGNSIGVFTCLPLLWIYKGKTSTLSLKRKWLFSIPIISFSALITFGLWNILNQENQYEQFHFSLDSERLSNQFERDLHDRLRLHKAIRSYVETIPNVTYQQFTHFSWPLIQDNYLTGISWIPRVHGHERTAFEKAMRKQGLEGYHIRDKNERDEWLYAGRRAEYFPITYTLPADVQAKTQGYDILHEPLRRAVIEDARDSGEPRLLTPINLLASQGVGFIIYLPVYEKPATSIQERRNHLSGFIASGVVLSDMLQPLAEQATNANIMFALTIGDSAYSLATPIYTSSAAFPASSGTQSNHHSNIFTKSFDFAGSTLLLTFMPSSTDKNILPHWKLWLAFITGGTLIGLTGALILVMAGRIEMVQRLVAERTEELHISKERLKLVIEGTVDGVWDWPDTTKDEVYWSPKWKAMLGYADDEITGSKTKFRELLHPDDVAPCEAAIHACLNEGKAFDIEYRLRKKNGDYGWLHGKGVVSSSHGITRMTGSITDITERKFAEIIRERLIKQLTDTNEQLEQFAYVASHDLREPLRLIVNFTDLLMKEYSAHLNGEAIDYMQIMCNAARKMDAMVSDLLDYGRHSQENKRYDEIDCNRQLLHVQENLSEAIKATHAQIIAEPLPVVIGNPTRFSRLLQNLISNALKYQKPGSAPHITISAQDQADCWEFCIADNGLGIKSEYHESIFAPFTRLHSDHEFAGTGIGLAICRKIVEGMGGRIWVKSAHGEGSRFYFTIPKRTAEQQS